MVLSFRSAYTPGLLLLFLAACGEPAPQAETSREPPRTVPSTQAPEAAPGPAYTVRQYLNWYNSHQNNLPGDFILNSDGQDTTKFYAVNFSATERWLAAVRQSGLVSETYLNRWRTHFQQYADSLQLHPQNDGPAAGFDYDFLMLSQEPDAQVADLLSGTTALAWNRGSQALVQARGPRHGGGWQFGLNFMLIQDSGGRWLIDGVSQAESDL